nr:hypothetical protein Ade03nite_66590 [Actinoplanes derwentensis]
MASPVLPGAAPIDGAATCGTPPDAGDVAPPPGDVVDDPDPPVRTGAPGVPRLGVPCCGFPPPIRWAISTSMPPRNEELAVAIALNEPPAPAV